MSRVLNDLRAAKILLAAMRNHHQNLWGDDSLCDDLVGSFSIIAQKYIRRELGNQQSNSEILTALHLATHKFFNGMLYFISLPLYLGSLPYPDDAVNDKYAGVNIKCCIDLMIKYNCIERRESGLYGFSPWLSILVQGSGAFQADEVLRTVVGVSLTTIEKQLNFIDMVFYIDHLSNAYDDYLELGDKIKIISKPLFILYLLGYLSQSNVRFEGGWINDFESKMHSMLSPMYPLMYAMALNDIFITELTVSGSDTDPNDYVGILFAEVASGSSDKHYRLTPLGNGVRKKLLKAEVW